MQQKVVRDLLKGEEKEYFIQLIDEINSNAEKAKNFSLEKEAEKWREETISATKNYFKDIAIPFLHYFNSSSDIYVFEWSELEKEFFTFTVLNGDVQNAEFGYQSISELFRNYGFGKSFELDFHFTPKPINQLVNGLNGLGTAMHNRFKQSNITKEFNQAKRFNERNAPEIIEVSTAKNIW